MPIFDRYLFKNVGIATLFTSVTLAGVILLTQSLRFLELVIESGASSTAFWILAALALPRFFEIILPLSLMIGVLFVYNKLVVDSELVVMRSGGSSPFKLARPALILSALMTFLLLFITTWLAPVSLSSMQHTRQVVKAQYSSLFFKEGIFNDIRPGLTVFLRSRDENGLLEGLMIHDSRTKDQPPVTIIAKTGRMLVTEEGQQVVVYDGSRQSWNEKNTALNKLDFEQYTIDLPDGQGNVRKRWREPDERTFIELLNPDRENVNDMHNLDEFVLEAHRRIASPLLAPSFVIIALACLLLGQADRRGQAKRIMAAIAMVVLFQGLYLGAFNIASQNIGGLFLMYGCAFLPAIIGLFLLSHFSEKLRKRLFL